MPERDVMDAVSTILVVLEGDDEEALFGAVVDDAEALLAAPAAGPHPEVALQLGRLHWARWQRLPEDADELELAMALGWFVLAWDHAAHRMPDQVRELLDPEPGPAPEAAANVALILLRQGRQRPGVLLLDGSLHVARAALTRSGIDPEVRLALAGYAMAACLSRGERLGAAGDMDEAVRWGRHGVETVPADSPNRATAYGNLAAPLLAWARALDRADDLDGAIEAARQAVGIGERSGGGDLPTYRTNLAGALRLRYEKVGDEADLDEALGLGRAAVADLPATHSELPQLLMGYASTLRLSYEAAGRDDDLDEAVRVHRRAVGLLSPDHPTRAVALANLGTALREVHDRDGDVAVLDEAITLHTDAYAAGSAHPQFAVLATGLSNSLGSRFDATGDPSALRRAIELGREALAHTGTRNRASRMSNLGSLLWTSASLSGSGDEIDEAVDLLESAARLADADPDGLDSPDLLSNLAAVLLLSHELFGRTEVLDRAAAVARRAADHPSRLAPRRRIHHTTLGNVLLTLYEVVGDTAYLDTAVAELRAALATLAPDHPDSGAFLSNLGNALRARFTRGDTGAGEEAVALLQSAVEATPPSRPEYPTYASNLASLHHARYAATMDAGQDGVDDLDRAIELDRHAAEVSRRGAGAVDLPCVLSNLSISLRARYAARGDPADLDAAVAAADEAVRTAPADHPNRAVYLGGLAAALEDVADVPGAHGDIERVIDLYREAAQSRQSGPVPRVMAAHRWGRTACLAGRPEEGRTAFTTAYGLLARVSPRQLGWSDQQQQLTRITGLATDAAACALECADPGLAASWLETGRGVLLAQRLEYRTELDDVRAADLGLADRFAALCEALVRDHGVDRARDRPAAAVLANRREALDRQWEEVVTAIRGLRGLEGFLRPPTVPDLLAAVRGGIVAMVNVSGIRSDAVLLTPRGLLTVALPDLTPETTADRTALMGRALQAVQDPDTSWERAEQAERDIASVLEWAWDTVARPVLDLLDSAGVTGSGHTPRLWWSATGGLAHLPLHAAGRHTAYTGESVLDRVVPAYTPIVRVLRHLGTSPGAAPADDGLLIVPGETGGDTAALPDAADEVGDLLRRVPAATVADPAGTGRDDLLAQLAGHPWVHLACHGTSDAVDPSSSRLLIHNPATGTNTDTGTLTVRDLAHLRLTDARLAFLSACDTARTGERIPEESIHIASAFQLAGFRSVIGTLWPIVDSVARETADAVYGLLVDDGRLVDGVDVAAVLHQVVRAQRDRYPDHPSLWASHVYAGV